MLSDGESIASFSCQRFTKQNKEKQTKKNPKTPTKDPICILQYVPASEEGQSVIAIPLLGKTVLMSYTLCLMTSILFAVSQPLNNDEFSKNLYSDTKTYAITFQRSFQS